PSLSLLGHLTNSLFFFVGWHYVKQIFGGVVVSNALTGYDYDKITRHILKINLFSVWAVSFLSFQTSSRSLSSYGIPYHTYNLPEWTFKYAQTAFIFTAVALVVLHIQRYLKDKKVPCLAAVVCLLSIYVWYIPAFRNASFFYMIPFFHSLQYLLFAYAFRRNKVEVLLRKKETPVNKLKKWLEIGVHLFMVELFVGVLIHYLA